MQGGASLGMIDREMQGGASLDRVGPVWIEMQARMHCGASLDRN